jgi:hypothetical protein
MRVKYLKVKAGEKLHINSLPSFSATGSIRGMKKTVDGKDALLVRCGSYVYNVTSKPEIYEAAK